MDSLSLISCPPDYIKLDAYKRLYYNEYLNFSKISCGMVPPGASFAMYKSASSATIVLSKSNATRIFFAI